MIKILIVDDVEANLYSLNALLSELKTKEYQFEILQALSGEEALKIAIQDRDIRLIILDVQMPDMDGFEVAKLLQSSSITKNIPIVFLTAAFKAEEFVQHGFDLGAIDYFTKPIEKVQFLNKIRFYLDMIIKNFQLKELNDKLEEEIKKEEEANDKLMHQANYDALTELPNRANLSEVIDTEIKMQNDFALFFIDLDNFKDINDTYGHNIGDILLIDVSKRIQRVLKRTDFVARLGGDEFCVVVKNISDTNIIANIAKKINKTLSEAFILENIKIYSTASIGITLYPQDATNLHELLKNADTAMYAIKKSGRNGFCFYEKNMNQENKKRLTLESQLREALENKEFEVYFQPQVESVKNKIIGYEALVRWNHPTLGLLPPSKFLDIAKSIGIMDKIDEFVMSEAIKSVKDFHCIEKHRTMSINVSGHILYKENFLQRFTDLLKKFECETKTIELELTEDELISDVNKITPILKTLGKMGVNIAIDDFGTGYSSLRYLKDLHVDRLKIDKSFIDDIESENSILIIKAIIALGNSLNLSVIAEGVEDEKQKKFLEQNECTEIQGYLYSKPLKKKDVIEFNKKMDYSL